jgi:hypothetical protein
MVLAVHMVLLATKCLCCGLTILWKEGILPCPFVVLLPFLGNGPIRIGFGSGFLCQFAEELNLSSQSKDLTLLLGGGRPLIGEFPCLVLGQGVGQEIVGIYILSLFIGVNLASDKISKLNIICSLVSLEKIDQEIARSLSPSREIFNLCIDVLIEGFDVGIQFNHLGIQKR